MRKFMISLFSIVILWALFTLSCRIKKSYVKTDDVETDYPAYSDPNPQNTEATFKVSFVDGSTVLYTQLVQEGDTVSIFIPEKEGYTFIGWNANGDLFDFNDKISKDIVLTAVWELNEKADILPTSPAEPTVYKIRYYIDNVCISTIDYVVDTEYIPPAIPEIDDYDGYWRLNNVNGNIVTIVAEYQPKQFKLIFKINGEEFAVRNYQAGDIIDEPHLPQIDGYTAYWQPYEIAKNEITIVEAVYSPIIYHAYFFADGKLEHTIPFSTESPITELPLVPLKEGYDGYWNEFDFELNDIVVNSVYTPINYTATFITDGAIVATKTFNIENMNVIAPPIVLKTGYIAKWEDFIVGLKNFEVQAVYTPLIDSDFIYELTENETAYRITSYVDEASHVVIPQLYSGLPVVSIGKNVFSGKPIESVEISFGIETIEQNAFQDCKNLKNIYLPETLKSIGEYAFSGCTSLKSIKIPESIELICPYAFENCTALKSIEFSNYECWLFEHSLNSEGTQIPERYFSDSYQAAIIYPSISTYYLLNKYKINSGNVNVSAV